MKKLWKLIALTLVVVFAVAAIAAAAPIPIVDPNNALTKADAKSLEGRIKELERKHSINIGVLLLTVPNGKQSGAVASGYLTQNGYANAVNGGVVLLLDLQNHGWYVATDKKMEKAITAEYGVKRLGTNIVANMKSNSNPAPAIRSFLTGVDELYGYYHTNGKAMTKANETKAGAAKQAGGTQDKSPGIFSYLAGLVASVAAAFGYRSNLRSKMSNVATANTATEYVDEEGLNMTTATDEFDHTDIERTPRATSKPRETQDDVVTESHNDDKSSGGGGKW